MEIELVNKYKMEINKDFRKYAENALKDYDFAISNLRYLLLIERRSGISLNEIAIELNIDKAMVTRGIKKLVELGYVNKEQDKIDTRVYRLTLSKKGEEALGSLSGIFKEWFDKVTHDFDEEEKDIYMKLIKKVYENRVYK
ncbi:MULTISPECIES: MarR family winged helix-turn-helix transcriptional regulator [Romboutsia]|uniref:Helix_turn_helix multiple antibiotic resistance protein n=2 Tax=Romboutsia TaxID=1501226 RepID=A0A2P2BSS7_9FIRM|nr:MULTISPECIES: MarR family transcriptional regulator [Romboutsia]MCH1960667.1 MarR family transcriptional regulator [Romboutsia hominis]MCH1968901.1 MarR family transcriptional regulator [Romboutsia hominis]MDB8793579.1 MarR family transcriptional regulator [Romboutsia sp. 1001216sp1]MDB8794976.1 MarR family transcriptional regulator [Romboutsia sp. 1001216sp1]MDB8798787.1 MarR family transcriptional regulator [Romboutsia sp. 1001216sp1]